MPIKFTIKELIWIICKRENKSIRKLAREMGYIPSTFYSKMHYNRWKIDDLKVIKSKLYIHFGASMADVLDNI
jgi:hypothetical protein